MDLSTHCAPCLRVPDKDHLLLLAEASQLCESRCTVQKLSPPHSGYLDQQAGQDRPCCPLDSYSILPVPDTESVLVSAGSLNEDTQQPDPTETITANAAESSGSGQAMHFTLEEVSVSETGEAGNVKDASLDKRRASRARYYASEKGKKSKAKYVKSLKGRVNQIIRSAKSRAYRAAVKQGFSEELARKQGELVAAKRRADFLSEFPCLSVTQPK